MTPTSLFVSTIALVALRVAAVMLLSRHLNR